MSRYAVVNSDKISVEIFDHRQAADTKCAALNAYHAGTMSFAVVPHIDIVDPPKLSQPCHHGHKCSCGR